MIKLDTTAKSLEVKLDAAAATTELPIYTSYSDVDQTTFQLVNASSSDAITTGATGKTAVDAPDSGETRKIDLVTVYNADTAARVVTVQVNNNSTIRILIQETLQPGETLQYADGEGWSVPNKKKQILSTVNSTETAATPFTGDWETNDFPWVFLGVKSDVNGSVTIAFSHDGSTIHSSFTYTVVANQYLYRPLQKNYRYVKVTGVFTSVTSLSIQTDYGFYDTGASPIGTTIGTDANAGLVKAVISGVGDTNATVTDHKALQVTPPPEGKSAFGEALVNQIEPVVQLLFNYNLNDLLVDIQDNGGSASIGTSMLTLSTGAAANQSSTMLSHDKTRYEPGLGLRVRFTALFTTGVANSSQIIGIGDSGEGFFVGYDGTSFGIMHRYGGNPEIRTLTVTTASSTAEDITITLDGDADATVTVTASANTTTTANEIADHDFSGLGRGWTATAVGATVVFTSWNSASRTGTYSLSGATTAVGTFAQTLAGVAPTDTWVAQASWNGDDIFDGNGLTGVTLDPTQGNVYQIDFQYLGFGTIRFYVEDPDDGELHLVHTIEYANANTRPSLDNPTMPLFAAVENTSNTSDIVLKSGSMGSFIDGKRRIFGVNRGVKRAATISASGETPLTTIRIAETYAGAVNRSQIKVNLIAGSVEHTKPVRFNIYTNATLTDASFSAIDSGKSAVFQDNAATALSGGTFLHSLPLGKAGQGGIDIKGELDLGRLGPGESLTIAAEYGSGTNAEVFASLNFTEML